MLRVKCVGRDVLPDFECDEMRDRFDSGDSTSDLLRKVYRMHISADCPIQESV